jgi:hypothetical protein
MLSKARPDNLAGAFWEKKNGLAETHHRTHFGWLRNQRLRLRRRLTAAPIYQRRRGLGRVAIAGSAALWCSSRVETPLDEFLR